LAWYVAKAAQLKATNQTWGRFNKLTPNRGFDMSHTTLLLIIILLLLFVGGGWYGRGRWY